ncbi:MAG TPA: F0F1 ATP synthase subunit B, partial [Nitrosospira sp.]|nr:F0F1 ATP synthase subunit B [Nitrosospira sp.]
MLIDWFTVIAQIINFLILVWLLKRVLYQPILNALDARERRIAAALADADARKSEAEDERRAFQQKNDELDQQRAELLRQALDEARGERERLVSTAHQDALELRAKQEKALRLEYHNLDQAIARQTSAEVFAIVRKVLADMANIPLEAQMMESFIKRLRELSGEEKAQLVLAVREHVLRSPATAANETLVPGVVVRSMFELSSAQQNMIKAALGDILDKEVSPGIQEVQIRFATRPDLISGVELIMNGYKLAWNVA